MTIRVKKGTVLRFLGSDVEITGYNGSLYYVTRTDYDENGVCNVEDDRLTANDIDRYLREVDGNSHRIIWDGDEDEDEEGEEDE